MLLIDNNNKITMTQGDTGYLNVVVPGYTMTRGDKLYLSVSSGEVGGFGTGGTLFTVQTTSFSPDGMGTLKIDPSQTKHVNGLHYYDIQLTKANGDIHTIVPISLFEILQEVTTR